MLYCGGGRGVDLKRQEYAYCRHFSLFNVGFRTGTCNTRSLNVCSTFRQNDAVNATAIQWCSLRQLLNWLNAHGSREIYVGCNIILCNCPYKPGFGMQWEKRILIKTPANLTGTDRGVPQYKGILKDHGVCSRGAQVFRRSLWQWWTRYIDTIRPWLVSLPHWTWLMKVGCQRYLPNWA